jgi:4-oxalocrotonate tautomerase
MTAMIEANIILGLFVSALIKARMNATITATLRTAPYGIWLSLQYVKHFVHLRKDVFSIRQGLLKRNEKSINNKIREVSWIIQVKKEGKMPLVEIHMLKGRTDEQKRALLDGVTEAVRDSLGVPLTSIRVWIQEFSRKDFMVAGELYADRKK